MTEAAAAAPRASLSFVSMLPCPASDIGRRIFAHVFVGPRHWADYRGPLERPLGDVMSWLVPGHGWVKAMVEQRVGKPPRLVFARPSDYQMVAAAANQHRAMLFTPQAGVRHD
ncbi:MAG: hypothetical protein J0H82_30290 [Alphaproteobacteria bacterium]|nr:hypothetical protein [Alphaproteobacteria bacterium]